MEPIQFTIMKHVLSRYGIVVLGLLLCSTIVHGQAFTAEEGLSVRELFRTGNYGIALKKFEKLSEEDPKNMDYKYSIAQCFLYINNDKSSAIPLLQEVWKNDDLNPEVLFDLGCAYHFNMRFQEAIDSFNEYKSLVNDVANKERAERKIEMCYNAMELIKYPLDVTFENLGAKVNSPYPDFSPFVPADESYLVFTSRRKGNVGHMLDYDGFYTSDLYMSTVKKGAFYKAANISIINTESDEEAAGISSDGSKILVFVDDVFRNIYGNIFFSTKRGRSLQNLASMGKTINSPTSIETSAAITKDGNILYFSSDRPEGYGGMDIYMSRLLPDGSWGIPINLGPKINTKYNEEYPTLSLNENLLYFSSDGHNSMGGYDLFRSEFSIKANEWGSPSNLGYPISTTDDDMTISFAAIWDTQKQLASNKHAYISTYRKDGFGDLDIYRVTFNKEESRLTTVRGLIIEKIPVDMNEYKIFYHYSKAGEELVVPEECYPWDDRSWRLKEEKKVMVRPGYEYRSLLFFDKNGQQKVFSSKKYPKNDNTLKIVKIKNSLIKKKNYTPPIQIYEETPLIETNIYVTNKMSGEEFSYVPSRKGKYTILLPPGEYEMKLEHAKYKSLTYNLSIWDKGSFVPEKVKNFIFEPEK